MPARIVAMFRVTGSVMVGKGEDCTQGLAERSLNTSIVHPDHRHSEREQQKQGSASNRVLPDNQQREGIEKAIPAHSKLAAANKGDR